MRVKKGAGSKARRERQIVAMGGGGFSMEPRNALLDRYVLSLTRRRSPRICFLPTASGDSDGYANKFTAAFHKLGARPSVLSLFRPPKGSLRQLLLSQDAIYVGGGNTWNMLLLWRAWGLDRILREAWRNGIVLAGTSAGSICWFDEGTTDSFGLPLRPMKCLGFLPGSNCPHDNGEKDRRPSFRRLIANSSLKPGYGTDDGVALHYIGRRLHRVVSSRPGACAWKLERVDGRVRENKLVPDFLGGWPFTTTPAKAFSRHRGRRTNVGVAELRAAVYPASFGITGQKRAR